MATRTQPADTGLQRDAIGLAPVLFQSITHMAPAAAVAFSIIFAVTYAGGATPLAVLLALVACLSSPSASASSPRICLRRAASTRTAPAACTRRWATSSRGDSCLRSRWSRRSST